MEAQGDGDSSPETPEGFGMVDCEPQGEVRSLPVVHRGQTLLSDAEDWRNRIQVEIARYWSVLGGQGRDMR